ncbi:MAG: hypothetical protein WCT18_00410 [Patescibacteria group bacterium]
MKKCLVCNKELLAKYIEKHEAIFCSDECVQVYEGKLKELDEVIDWEKCC